MATQVRRIILWFRGCRRTGFESAVCRRSAFLDYPAPFCFSAQTVMFATRKCALPVVVSTQGKIVGVAWWEMDPNPYSVFSARSSLLYELRGVERHPEKIWQMEAGDGAIEEAKAGPKASGVVLEEDQDGKGAL